MVPRLVLLLRSLVLGTLIAFGALGLGAAAGHAQSGPANPAPPTAATGAVEAISQTGATFTGTVASEGVATKVRFEYGTTAGYGLSTGEVEVPAGEQRVTISVVNLTAGTGYHVRIVATNAAGVTRGLDQAFTSAGTPRPPATQTRSVTGLGASGATLMARVDPRAQPTTVYWEYGPSSAYGQRTPEQTIQAGSGPVFVSHALTGLAANTTYSYRAVAVNAAGTTRGNRHTFRTTRGVASVSLKLAARHVSWSDQALLGGKVSGLSVNGVQVTLWRQDHPFTGDFRPVGSVKATQDGTFGFTTPPLYWATRFRVTADTPAGIASPTQTTLGDLRTKLRVSSRHRSKMQLRGLVYPGAKGSAVIERRTPKGRWVRVKTVALSVDDRANRSAFRVWVPRLSSRSARYRAVVTPRDGGAHVKTATRSTVVARR